MTSSDVVRIIAGIPSTEFLQIEPSSESEYPFSMGPYEGLTELFDL